MNERVNHHSVGVKKIFLLTRIQNNKFLANTVLMKRCAGMVTTIY